MTVRESNLVPFTVLDPLPVENLGWEVKVFALDDPTTLLAYIPRWRGLVFTDELNEVGMGEIELPIDDPMWDVPLDDPAYVDVFHLVSDFPVLFRIYHDGVQRFAFIHEESEEMRVSEDGLFYKIVGPSLDILLDWATILPRNWNNDPFPYDPDNDHNVFVDQPYAAAIHQFWTSAKNRGCYPDMEITFFGHADSFGIPWPDSQTYDVQVGGTLLDRVQQYSNLGAFDWYVNLDQKFRAVPHKGSDKSDEVVFFAAHGLKSTVKKRSRKHIRTYLALESDGTIVEVSDGASASRWMRREGYIDSSDTTDAATRLAIAQESLRLSAQEQLGREVDVTDQQTEGRRLWIDFVIGDDVSIDDGVTKRPFRVIGWTVSVGAPDDDARFEIGLQGWFDAWQSKVQRKIERLTQHEADVAAKTTQKGTSTTHQVAQQTQQAIQATTLDGLSDVEYPTARSDHDVLFWNATAGKWQNGKVLLGDLIDVDETITPQDGYVLTWDAAAGKYQPKFSSGGGGLAWSDPVQAGAPKGAPVLADEFNDAAFHADWVKVEDVARVTWREGGDLLSAKFDNVVVGAASKPHAIVRPLPPGLTAFTMDVALRRLNEYAVNYMMWGPVISGGTSYTTSPLIWCMQYQDTSTAGAKPSVRYGNNWTAGTDWGSQSWSGDWSPWLYWRCIWKGGSSWQFLIGDGINWLDYLGGVKTFAMTPTHVGLGIGTWGSAGRRGIGSCEFLRVYGADLGVAPVQAYDDL